MGPVNNCCHCGGTMVCEWHPLTKKEASILNLILEAADATSHQGTPKITMPVANEDAKPKA